MTGIAMQLDAIPWTENPNGTRSAVLAGDRNDTLPFTYAFALPAGSWDRPHCHGVDIHLVVARGVLRFDWGAAADPEGAMLLPVGSFLHVPAHRPHGDGAATEGDVIIIGTALGPWSTEYC